MAPKKAKINAAGAQAAVMAMQVAALPGGDAAVCPPDNLNTEHMANIHSALQTILANPVFANILKDQPIGIDGNAHQHLAGHKAPGLFNYKRYSQTCAVCVVVVFLLPVVVLHVLPNLC